jgi:hypothetical protein
MVLAMRHGVLGYEAMGLNCLFPIFAFGVFNYAATRTNNKSKPVIDSPPLNFRK